MSPLTIAVIDDDADLLNLLRLLFEERGWATLTFTDSAEALDALQEAPPSLIILDRLLGRRSSGWEVLRDVRAAPRLDTVPVIICSGLTDDLRADEPRLNEQGIAILSKPFDIDDLYTMVDAALQDDVQAFRPVEASGAACW